MKTIHNEKFTALVAGIELIPLIINMAAWSNKHNIFDAHTIEFLKPLQENNNLALKAFIKKLKLAHLN